MTDKKKQRGTITRPAFDVLEKARQDAELYLNPYVTPEHVLFQMESAGVLNQVWEYNTLEPFYFRERLGLFISALGSVELTSEYSPQISDNLRFAIEYAIEEAVREGGKPVGLHHLLLGMACQKDSLAGFLLRKHPEVLQGFGVSFPSPVDCLL